MFSRLLQKYARFQLLLVIASIPISKFDHNEANGNLGNPFQVCMSPLERAMYYLVAALAASAGDVPAIHGP